MYEFIDRPVTSLDHGGRLLVWAMRSWVTAVKDRKCPAHALAPAFASAKILSSLQQFLRTMGLFNRHGLETFQFHAVNCARISEHEAILLSLFQAMRGQLREMARETLGLLVEEVAVDDLLLSLSHLTGAMAATGLTIAEGCEAASTPAAGSSPSSS